VSQTLVITNLTDSQIDFAEGILAPNGELTVIVPDTIPADILSAQSNGIISYTTSGSTDVGPAGPTGPTGPTGPAGPTGPTG
jgi:hypothetical protein